MTETAAGPRRMKLPKAFVHSFPRPGVYLVRLDGLSADDLGGRWRQFGEPVKFRVRWLRSPDPKAQAYIEKTDAHPSHDKDPGIVGVLAAGRGRRSAESALATPGSAGGMILRGVFGVETEDKIPADAWPRYLVVCRNSAPIPEYRMVLYDSEAALLDFLPLSDEEIVAQVFDAPDVTTNEASGGRSTA